MKISLFTQYGALNSRPVFEAFEQGAQKLGYKVVLNDVDADIFVIWSVLWEGRMKNNQQIWNLAKKNKKVVIVLEVGGLIRGKTWRIGLNHVNNLALFCHSDDFDELRPKKLGIFLCPRQNSGKNVLICGQHSKSEQWSYRSSPEIWISDLVKEIKTYSNRKIVFRPHPRDYHWARSLLNLDIDIHIPQKIPGSYDDFDLNQDFKDAWCVISPSSNPGIQAAIAGIPVFTDLDSLAYPISNKNLSKIEHPELPDREKWLISVSHTEYLIEEITEGTPIKQLLKNLDI